MSLANDTKINYLILQLKILMIMGMEFLLFKIFVSYYC